MTISPIHSTAAIQAEPQAAVSKAAVPHAPSSPTPAYTVSLSSTAQKATGGDVDHDGDSH